MKKLFLVLFAFCTVLLATSCNPEVKAVDPLVVETTEDGFYFKVKNKAEQINITIQVYDVEEQMFNLDLFYKVKDGSKSQKFFYPFVTAGKKYTIYLNAEDSNWSNGTYHTVYSVEAAGGKGDFKIVSGGIGYDGDKTLQIQNYAKICPEGYENYGYMGAGLYYTNNEELNSWNWYNYWGDGNPSAINANKQTGELVLTDNSVARLAENNYFWVRYYFNTSIDDSGVIYQKYCNDGAHTFKYQVADKYYMTTDRVLNVKATSDGLYILKNTNYYYEHFKIHVEDITKNVTCPTVVLGLSSYDGKYPFTEKTHTYKIYLEMWDENWGSYYKSPSIEIVAKGGYGDSYATYDSYKYETKEVDGSMTAAIVLDKLFITFPGALAAELYDNGVSGNLYYRRDKNDSYSQIWDTFPLNDGGVIDISKQYYRLAGSEFIAQLAYEFLCANNKYELQLIYNDEDPFVDSNEAPALILKKDYQEIAEYGDYQVDEKQQNKAAFLIKFNKTYAPIADKADIKANVAMRAAKRSAAADGLIENLLGSDKPQILCGTNFEMPMDFGEELPMSRTARSAEDYTSYVIDTTTKNFYDDQNKLYTATLKAIGNKCNVWYTNNNNAADKKLMDAMDSSKKETYKEGLSFQGLADRFDALFEKETLLVGSNVPEKNYSYLITVTEDTKIDIFVFDIGSDYKGQNGGIYGYFHGRDLYTTYTYSNKCEMIYIDSGFLGNDPSGMYGTLAHEFQHLLHAVNKGINKGLAGSSWFTEFMSLASEDVLNYHIEGSRGIKGRVSGCNEAYYTGFEDWNATLDGVSYSYSNAAVFADFLMKNYGGVNLFYEIAHNSYTGEEAIEAGLHKLGYSESYESLMKKFGVALIFAGSDEENVPYGLTANKTITDLFLINGANVPFTLDSLDYTNYDYGYYNSKLYNNSYSKTLWVRRKGDYTRNCGPLILYGNTNFGKIYGRAIGVKYLGTNQTHYNIENPGDDYQVSIVFAK